MNEQVQKQIEAIETVYEYNKKLSSGIELLIQELQENRMEENKELLHEIIEGLNWVFGILNYTIDRLNETGIAITKESVNKVVLNFSASFQKNNPEEMSLVLKEEILPMLSDISSASKIAAKIEEN